MTIPRKAIEAGARALAASLDGGRITSLHYEIATACLTAALAAEGLAIVPLEPTDEMRAAAVQDLVPKKVGDPPLYEAIYRAMLSANGGEDA